MVGGWLLALLTAMSLLCKIPLASFSLALICIYLNALRLLPFLWFELANLWNFWSLDIFLVYTFRGLPSQNLSGTLSLAIGNLTNLESV